MAFEKVATLVLLSVGAAALTALAHRQAARLGLPTPLTQVVGAAVLGVAAPRLARSL